MNGFAYVFAKANLWHHYIDMTNNTTTHLLYNIFIQGQTIPHITRSTTIPRAVPQTRILIKILPHFLPNPKQSKKSNGEAAANVPLSYCDVKVIADHSHHPKQYVRQVVRGHSRRHRDLCQRHHKIYPINRRHRPISTSQYMLYLLEVPWRGPHRQIHLLTRTTSAGHLMRLDEMDDPPGHHQVHIRDFPFHLLHMFTIGL